MLLIKAAVVFSLLAIFLIKANTASLLCYNESGAVHFKVAVRLLRHVTEHEQMACIEFDFLKIHILFSALEGSPLALLCLLL